MQILRKTGIFLIIAIAFGAMGMFCAEDAHGAQDVTSYAEVTGITIQNSSGADIDIDKGDDPADYTNGIGNAQNAGFTIDWKIDTGSTYLLQDGDKIKFPISATTPPRRVQEFLFASTSQEPLVSKGTDGSEIIIGTWGINVGADGNPTLDITFNENAKTSSVWNARCKTGQSFQRFLAVLDSEVRQLTIGDKTVKYLARKSNHSPISLTTYGTKSPVMPTNNRINWNITIGREAEQYLTDQKYKDNIQDDDWVNENLYRRNFYVEDEIESITEPAISIRADLLPPLSPENPIACVNNAPNRLIEGAFTRLYQEEGESKDDFRERVKLEELRYGLYFDGESYTLMWNLGTWPNPKVKYKDPQGRWEDIYAYADSPRSSTNDFWNDTVKPVWVQTHSEDNCIGGAISWVTLTVRSTYEPVAFDTVKTNEVVFSDSKGGKTVPAQGTLQRIDSIVTPETGGATLYKYDAQSNTFIEGAEFKLQRKSASGWTDWTDGSGNSRFTTDSDGRIALSGLVNGEYRFVEIEPAPGYEDDAAIFYEKDQTTEITDETHFIIDIANQDEGALIYASNSKITYGGIKITKKLEGNDTNPDKEFDFTVTAKEHNGTPVDGTFGNVTFNNGTATFQLKGGESVTIGGLKNRTKLNISEADYTGDNGGYESVVFKNSSGNTIDPSDIRVKGNTTAEYTAVNTRNTYGTVRITKKLEGNDVDPNKEFWFTGRLTNSAGRPAVDVALEEWSATPDTTGTPISKLSDLVTDSNGRFRFSLKAGESKSIMGMPNGLKYWFDEDSYTAEGYEEEKYQNYQGNPLSVSAIGADVEGGKRHSYFAVNTRNTYGDLTVKKHVTGNAGDHSKPFTFKMSLTGLEASKAYSIEGNGTLDSASVGTIDATGSTVTSDGTGKAVFTAKMTGSQSITVKALPNGAKYEIEEVEANDDGYTTTWSGPTAGTIVGGDNSKVELTATNTKSTYGSITLTKKLGGNDRDKDAEFDFTVHFDDAAGNDLVNTSFNSEDRTDENGNIRVRLKDGGSRTIADIPNNTSYKITEDDYTGTNGGYEEVVFYDKDDNKLGKTVSKTLSGNNHVAFTAVNTKNTYGDLSIKKEVTGNDANKNKEFTFTVTLTGLEASKAYSIDGNGTLDTASVGTIDAGSSTITSDENGKAVFTAKMADSKAITVKALPNGARYEVAEAEANKGGYVTSWSGPTTGSIKGGDGSEVELTATNTRNTYGDLTIKKKVAGNDADQSKAFGFTVTLTDASGDAIPEGTTFGTGGDAVTVGEGGKVKFQLKHTDPGKTIKGLPNGTRYEVEEDDDQGGYETTWSGPVSGTITGGDESETELTATNTRNTYGSIVLAKKVSGNAADTNKEFEFTITLTHEADGTQTPLAGHKLDVEGTEVTTGADGKATVKVKHEESKTISGIPNGAKYTIEETDEDITDYDEVIFRYTENNRLVTPTDMTMKGGSTISYTAYNHCDTYGDLTIKKVVAGNDADKNKEFTFEVTLTGLEASKSYDIEGSGTLVSASIGTINTGTGSKTITSDGDGNATFVAKMADSQSITVKGLPNGAGYTAVENEADQEYTTTKTGDEGTIEGKKTKEAVFTNTKNSYGNLEVKKVAGGVNADKVSSFGFTVTLSDTTINGKKGDMTFENGVATFSLGNGDTAKATDIPFGITYEVTEDDYSADGYSSAVTEGSAAGTIEKDKTASVTFTNTRSADGSLTISKQLAGNNQNGDDVFTFEISLISDDQDVVNGKYTATKNGTGSEIQFNNGKAETTLKGNEAITIEGLPHGTGYEVVETDSLDYTSSHNGNTGSIDEDKPAVVAFTNTRNFSPVIVDPPIKKVVEGTSLKEPFIFTMEPVGNNAGIAVADMPMPEGSVNGKKQITQEGGGEYEFGEFEIALPGTYVYRMFEEKGDLSYNYDGSTYTVTYVVTADGNSLNAERTITKDGEEVDEAVFTNRYIEDPTEPTKPTDPDDGDKATTPTDSTDPDPDDPGEDEDQDRGKKTSDTSDNGSDTGDHTNLPIWLLSMLISITVVIGYAAKRRRQQ